MKKEDELSVLLQSGKLIELCNETKNSDSWVVNKWYEKEEKKYILPLKSGSTIDPSKILNASCILGIKLVNEKVTSTQLRKLLTRFQIAKEKIKSSDDDVVEITKLKLNLAYITARNSNIMELADLLDSMLDKDKFPENKEMNKIQFGNVVTLLEGVIAYHKLAGGRD